MRGLGVPTKAINDQSEIECRAQRHAVLGPVELRDRLEVAAYDDFCLCELAGRRECIAEGCASGEPLRVTGVERFGASAPLLRERELERASVWQSARRA